MLLKPRLPLFAIFLLMALTAAAQTTFIWSGGAATVCSDSGSAELLAGGNWVGGVPPTDDGSATGSNLVFGATSGIDSKGQLLLMLDTPLNVRGLTFSTPYPHYYLTYSASAQPFGIGRRWHHGQRGRLELC